MNRAEFNKIESVGGEKRGSMALDILKIVLCGIYILFLILMLPLYGLYVLGRWLVYRHNLRSNMLNSGMPIDLVDELTEISFSKAEK